jgi:hypothetical protein
MTSDDKTPVLVFKDEAGDYFLVPQELLERGRVPAERRGDLERLLVEADADVSGYVASIAYNILRVINVSATAFGDFVAGTLDASLIKLEVISVTPVRPT